ncbi:MAG: hypothetical protein R2694_19575 [Ilumatobacteraceae bacterium]
MSSGGRLDAFVVAAPGLEPLLLDELTRLDVRPARAVKGGVECSVTWPQLWAVHLRSRLATRVLVRVWRFRATNWSELEAGLRRVPWGEWLADDAGVAVQATCSKSSALYHSGAVAERAAGMIGRPAGDQVVQVRVLDDVVTVSLDATGPALFKRGWRGPSGRAPMRETLAAALVLASGWDRRSPLVDPFCGSGTVAIEAAMIARRMSPGRHRQFAFQQWTSFSGEAWARLLRGADGDVIDRCPPILATDRDDGAVAAALENAAAAGVGEQVDVQRRSISDLVLPARPGWLVSNPPYGRRVGADVRDLYDRFGQVLRSSAGGWRVAVLAAKETPVARLGLPLTSGLHTSNGGIPVDVWCGPVAPPA